MGLHLVTIAFHVMAEGQSQALDHALALLRASAPAPAAVSVVALPGDRPPKPA